MEEKDIIIFDGVCNFCNGAVNFIIKRDLNKNFLFTPMQSQLSKKLIKTHNINININIKKDTIFLIKENKYLYKSSAVLEITKGLSGYWYLLNIFKVLPLSFRDFIYDLIAKNRYKIFGKKDSCMIPTADIKDRFVDI